jgi:hypothetical protein
MRVRSELNYPDFGIISNICAEYVPNTARCDATAPQSDARFDFKICLWFKERLLDVGCGGSKLGRTK